MKNQAHILLEKHMAELGLTFQREYRFTLDRKWRFDYILSEVMKHGLSIAIEIDGSAYTQGRHTRGQGYESDCEKFNRAAMAGFLVLRFTTGQVQKGIAREFLKRYLQ